MTLQLESLMDCSEDCAEISVSSTILSSSDDDHLASSPLSVYDNVALPKTCSCPDYWTWNLNDRAPEAYLAADTRGLHRQQQQDQGGECRTVVFHPHWSNGTAAVRGTKPLNSFAVHYWEVHVSRRLFGTSLQFGVATKSARLYVDSFVNLLGEDEHSWAMSHKGSLWHRGRCQTFVEPFDENESVLVGLLFDGPRGTLTYFKNGTCLGVAFTGLVTHPVGQPLYPIVSSTAAKTEMTLFRTLRSFNSLQDRCRATVVRHLANTVGTIDRLPVPRLIKGYIGELIAACEVDSSRTPADTNSITYKYSKPISKQQRSPKLCLKDWPEMITS